MCASSAGPAGRSTGTLGILLLLALTLSARQLPAAGVATTQLDCLAIIAHPDFLNASVPWSLERLCAWHNANDTLGAYIIDLNTILTDPAFHVDGPWGDGNGTNPYWRAAEDPITNPNLFNDTQAILRNYIRYAHHERDVKYVLLVGDEDQIPTRKLTADGYGAPAATADPIYYANVPTHLYYACLDGTFNDDEDVNTPGTVSGWGENATHNHDHDLDEVDWEYEVTVGRITPNNPSELNNVIRKTIAYMETPPHDSRLAHVVLAGHFLGFEGLADWGINFGLQLANATCTDWNHVTYGFDPTTYDHTFINADPLRPPDHLPYTDETVRTVFNTGLHIWYQCSHGSPTQWQSLGFGDTWDTADVPTLTNEFYPLVYGAMPCLSGQWDAGDCLAEVFVNDAHGAFAAIMNSRYGWGSYYDLHATSHFIGREFFDAYFYEGHTRLGDMLYDAIYDCDWLRAQNNGAIRWACYDQNLIGNPAVTLQLPTSPTPLLGDVDSDHDVDIYDIVAMARAYGSREGDPAYDPSCDLDTDGDIDIIDITIATDNYGKSW
jgi:hypothetical protein